MTWNNEWWILRGGYYNHEGTFFACSQSYIKIKIYKRNKPFNHLFIQSKSQWWDWWYIILTWILPITVRTRTYLKFGGFDIVDSLHVAWHVAVTRLFWCILTCNIETIVSSFRGGLIQESGIDVDVGDD